MRNIYFTGFVKIKQTNLRTQKNTGHIHSKHSINTSYYCYYYHHHTALMVMFTQLGYQNESKDRRVLIVQKHKTFKYPLRFVLYLIHCNQISHNIFSICLLRKERRKQKLEKAGTAQVQHTFNLENMCLILLFVSNQSRRSSFRSDQDSPSLCLQKIYILGEGNNKLSVKKTKFTCQVVAYIMKKCKEDKGTENGGA